MHTCLPSYLNSALVPFSSPFHSTMRSSPANLILATMSCSSSHTSKSQLNYRFEYVAPRNWNGLPDTVRLAPSVPTFRKRVKTYLFWQAFSPPQIHFSYWLDLLDYDLFHYIRLLYTGCALDYALSFYRRTIKFVYYYMIIH